MSEALANIRQWVNSGLGFVYPEICQICLKEPAKKAEGFVCAQCWQSVRFIRPPFCERCGLPYEGEISSSFECTNCREMQLEFRSARSAVVASEFVRNIIHRYKYRGDRWFEPFLADLLVREAVPVLAPQKWDMIVPVPLHPTKLRERQFNQAERLGACLSEASRIPLNNRVLRRVEFTETQTKLDRRQRAANMRKAFALRPNATVKGSRVVLVDDVFTTGATTSACAKVLIAAGAADVCVWTVARGL